MKPKIFNVLDPNLNLYQRFFIEASAGCGKTFSIENIYVRFLLNFEKGWMPSDLLVLTFTKEATKELRMRIRLAIENALYELENPHHAKLPYLREVVEEGGKALELSLRALSDALANFDQAQIFTLHSFCYRMLSEHLFEAKLNLEEEFKDSGASLKPVEQALRDFLSGQIDDSQFCSSQVRILFQHFRNDFNVLMKSCIFELAKERPSLKCASFHSVYEELAQKLQALKQKYGIEKEKLLADLFLSATQYKGGHSQKGAILPQLNRAIIRLVNLFSKISPSSLNSFLWDASLLFSHFNLENKKKRASIDVKLFYPEFFESFNKEVFPLIQSLISPENILSNLTHSVQKLLQSSLEINHTLTPNNLLESLEKLVRDASIAKKIAYQFEAVIVDEFQDTDPTQWGVLSSTFLTHRAVNFPFYLVGDPKQSIYAFRRADIYTYLKAAKELGEECRVVLDTNYRSQPDLIQALNDLFQKLDPNWVDLPKWNQTLTYHPIKSAPSASKRNYHDERKSIHFFISEERKKRASIPSKSLEEEKLFPFIVNEILRLHQNEKVPLNGFALLVRDRFQGSRLKNFLRKSKIPFKSTRPEALRGSEIAGAFLDLYTAVLEPKKLALIQKLELNPYFSFPFQAEQKEKSISLIMMHIAVHREILFNQGFLAFYKSLMTRSFSDRAPSIYDSILGLEDGLEIYLELEQIKDLLVEQEVIGKDPYELKLYLEELSDPTSLIDESIIKRQHIEKDAVNILSLHMSKGLEFEIVFALGLVNRTSQKEDLIPYESQEGVLLVPSTYCDKYTQSHYKELASEKLRQLYVALTRAKERLYIPYIVAPDVDENKNSPLELFLKRVHVDYPGFLSFIKGHQEISYSILENEIEAQCKRQESSEELVPPKEVSLSLSNALVHSFTSLSAKLEPYTPSLMAPHDFDPPIKTIHTLPAGAETGSLYHHIMEKIDFSKELNSVMSFVSETPYESWHDILLENIRDILNLEIQTNSGQVSLRNLSKNRLFKEIEFLYPAAKTSQHFGFTLKGDYLQGVIDLIFLYEGKYYILDYKTNWLGPDMGSYLNLEDTMKSHHYFLQASIYEEALKKYLGVFEKRPFEECFGGTLYLFVRGRACYTLEPSKVALHRE